MAVLNGDPRAKRSRRAGKILCMFLTARMFSVSLRPVAVDPREGRVVAADCPGDDLSIRLRAVETVGQDDYADLLFLERDREIPEDPPIAPMPESIPGIRALDPPAQPPRNGVRDSDVRPEHLSRHLI